MKVLEGVIEGRLRKIVRIDSMHYAVWIYGREEHDRCYFHSVADVVRHGRLRWFGHLERRSVDDWVSACRKVEVAGATRKEKEDLEGMCGYWPCTSQVGFSWTAHGANYEQKDDWKQRVLTLWPCGMEQSSSASAERRLHPIIKLFQKTLEDGPVQTDHPKIIIQ